jgi:hypothetical protein
MTKQRYDTRALAQAADRVSAVATSVDHAGDAVPKAQHVTSFGSAQSDLAAMGFPDAAAANYEALYGELDALRRQMQRATSLIAVESKRIAKVARRASGDALAIDGGGA